MHCHIARDFIAVVTASGVSCHASLFIMISWYSALELIRHVAYGSMSHGTSPAGQWRPESLLESLIHTDLFYMVLLSAKTLIHSNLLRPDPALSTKNTNKNRLPAGSNPSDQAVHTLTSGNIQVARKPDSQGFNQYVMYLLSRFLTLYVSIRKCILASVSLNFVVMQFLSHFLSQLTFCRN